MSRYGVSLTKDNLPVSPKTQLNDKHIIVCLV